MPLINFTTKELSKIECCIEGDGDTYGDLVYENILDKIQNVYLEENKLMRKGMPTGKMEKETQELLDYYNQLYNWEYNDMVDYIIEHGEKKFRNHYETFIEESN